MNDMIYRCGYVTILGRPNVGKSTLLNQILGQKISITSRKPQTTRLHLLGIKSDNNSQVIYVDTPGIQQSPTNAINRHMNREAINAIHDVDILIYMIEAMSWTDKDKHVLNLINSVEMPVILVLNKVDKIKNKQKLLPFIKKMEGKSKFTEIIPISAKTKDNISKLENFIQESLPVAPQLFPDDQITDRNEQFFAAEYIREKLTRKLGDELPYHLTVTIEYFKCEGNLVHISALIWVSSKGQKAIVIGKNGDILKQIGEQARIDMEKLFDKKVFLQTWVKVKEKWIDNIQALKQFGYSH